MTSGNTEKPVLASGVTIPAPLVLGKLREHFRNTYQLNETQVETMLVSSSKSLQQALASAYEILEGTKQEARFTLIFHGLKGLLLNMGESEWAAYTKELENKLTDGEQIDYRAAIGIIEKGLSEILSHVEGWHEKAVSSGNNPEKANDGGTSGGD